MMINTETHNYPKSREQEMEERSACSGIIDKDRMERMYKPEAVDDDKETVLLDTAGHLAHLNSWW